MVRVLLPVATTPTFSPAQPHETPRPATATGERILVVDDEAATLRYVTASLEHAGYRVQGVGDADAAYHAYFAQPGDPFALVLTDLVMPSMGGVEFARRLVRRDPSARVLFMSGHVTAELSQQETNPPYEMLAKPFRAEQLIRTVRSALDRGTHRAGSTEPGLLTTRK